MSRRVKFFVAVLLSLLILTASHFACMEEQGNFHAITPGEAYRSAQLDRDELEYYIKKHNIRSILNLRGENPDAQWYTEEKQVSAEHNVMHYDIALSASSEPSREDIQKLIKIFKSAPRPVLIHCLAGADRSGLAAAMWKVVVDKETKAEAAKQLSILYGHLPIGKTSAMDRFFRKWNPALN
ncbi:MAG: dual specificity protein phosphatase family protein [Nitrospirae bacterium]|nr:dual specificity protein phosphatase family protein [Nitrospirota bacterium]MCL5238842.1 dual specificity protein phosphatase family protein [Nitrospirota bacterium]